MPSQFGREDAVPASALFTPTMTEGALRWSWLLCWQAADHSQPKTSRQGTCLQNHQLFLAALCGADHVNAGCEGELAAALAPEWQEMVDTGLGEDEEKNGGCAL